MSQLRFVCIILFSFLLLSNLKASDDYNDLVTLFQEWRTFEKPPLLNGAPDYTSETFASRYKTFQQFQKRLQDIDYSNWPVDKKADWYVLLAEMNGFDFNYRILKPLMNSK